MPYSIEFGLVLLCFVCRLFLPFILYFIFLSIVCLFVKKRKEKASATKNLCWIYIHSLELRIKMYDFMQRIQILHSLNDSMTCFFISARFLYFLLLVSRRHSFFIFFFLLWVHVICAVSLSVTVVGLFLWLFYY